ncbi:N-methylhydantoinase A/acetone carboxylase, beta subunit [Rubellimicrobium thermophilum DSM 16684]|uniref:N-methylhydantoinase A/acetone carboxylase, beta subunit n=1 Tax=Rubellimicrobium thermophilum DSM 16684 TaxID=1123069 RepID=S9QU00_9RHOB|nr:hydantoinase/oxoprolinase family protein [Rubellimicrobium thermophilum]EPX83093.1 N-methylhydantoinase A/acetone carboxylase, beta subunit [Rubellimicrobium thermophilum DSM 16684]
MAILLGVDTGGTYTDAVLLDEAAGCVLAKAKALTTRPDPAGGVSAAIDAVLAAGRIDPAAVAMVSLSTTLATNALVEGQGGRAGLIAIGFEETDLSRDGLPAALGRDPLIRIAGGHDHAGQAVAPLDEEGLGKALSDLPEGLTGLAVAARFATRNPAHEIRAREIARAVTGLPVTCSHELSASLGGPRRALTALLNARLIGLIERLLRACEAHMIRAGIRAPLMVVRGDGALMAAAMAHEKPIETILSGPAASAAGAAWLARKRFALVSDIGGTTTDICLLRDGRPALDPDGARVGPWRTMVEAVAMRTHGLGGDSEIHVRPDLREGLRLGPRRVMPVALLAQAHPGLVHRALDAALSQPAAGEGSGRFVLPLWSGALPAGLDPREAAVAERLTGGPVTLAEAVRARTEAPALARLVARGLALEAGATPTDAAHVLGLQADFDREAAHKALALLARRRDGAGEPLADGAEGMARRILDRLTAQSVEALLEAAFAEDGWEDPAMLARHPLVAAGLRRDVSGRALVRTALSLDVPVVALGASAATHYPAIGARLGTCAIVPEHAEVANAVGAVVGRVAAHAEGTVTSPAPGLFLAHLPGGPARFGEVAEAIGALRRALGEEAEARARAAGAETVELREEMERREAVVEGQAMLVEARLRVTAQGRPRLAAG